MERGRRCVQVVVGDEAGAESWRGHDVIWWRGYASGWIKVEGLQGWIGHVGTEECRLEFLCEGRVGQRVLTIGQVPVTGSAGDGSDGFDGVVGRVVCERTHEETWSGGGLSPTLPARGVRVGGHGLWVSSLVILIGVVGAPLSLSTGSLGHGDLEEDVVRRPQFAVDRSAVGIIRAKIQHRVRLMDGRVDQLRMISLGQDKGWKNCKGRYVLLRFLYPHREMV